jgi:adenylate kinase
MSENTNQVLHNDIIFIAGIHGVGKSTLCKNVAKMHNVKHIVASELISTKLITKGVDFTDIKDNQRSIITRLKEELKENGTLLFDGHFTLLTADKNIWKIPEDTFKEINPKRIILLIDKPINIQKKLMKRDGLKHDINLIEKLQYEEVRYAKDISIILNIELDVIDINDRDDIMCHLNKILE